MRELIEADVWTIESDWILVTTNGILRSDGRAVMGKGIALRATELCPGIDVVLGEKIKEKGNHVYEIGHYGYSKMYQSSKRIYSFPTKHHWRDPSSIDLIHQSCKELRDIWDAQFQKPVVAMPVVGCGNGGLDYVHDVRPILLEFFPENKFVVAIDHAWRLDD